ncbi:unnamed protein product [Bursaphelenchus okinawaensis]|uniref:Uncharacterized protein n=1 Tax=Bursaphelenchus okinawaensis TaxID=465554 RepID=A0A811KQA7_9BILA|nr:unnamed protein product [Bursaphelenchus okinawaensis]CAG9107871.1 unnamed protein product [Bursaphelenchus okinawaensis]
MQSHDLNAFKTLTVAKAFASLFNIDLALETLKKNKALADKSISYQLLNLFKLFVRLHKLVNMDFKKLCYDHVVYRLKNETWTGAFSKFGDRSYRLRSHSQYYQWHSVCCPFTGKMAINFRNGYVIMTNIDFGLKEFTMIDFTSYGTTIFRVDIVNRGNELFVFGRNVLVVYDLNTYTTYVSYNCCWTCAAGYVIIRTGTIFDLLSKKEFKIDAKRARGFIHHSNLFDKFKYVGVRTTDDELVIIDNQTDERHHVCEWRYSMTVHIVDETDSVVIFSQELCRIYSMKRRMFVFVQHRDTQWRLFNSNTLFDNLQGSFLVHNKRMDCWQVKSCDSGLNLKPPEYNVFCEAGFVTLPTYKVVNAYPNGVDTCVYLSFKKGKFYKSKVE